jgi:hypothetical protein
MRRLFPLLLVALPWSARAADDSPLTFEWQAFREARAKKGEERRQALQALADRYDGKAVRFTGYVALAPAEVEEGKPWSWRITDDPKLKPALSFPVDMSRKDDRLKKGVRVTIEGKVSLLDTGSTAILDARVIEVQKE